jgi:hypothetical protein
MIKLRCLSEMETEEGPKDEGAAGAQGSHLPDSALLCSQLEWDMKLWWPHSEAMIAFLMGYSDSGDPALLHLFYQVAEYTFRQVSAVSLSPQGPGGV